MKNGAFGAECCDSVSLKGHFLATIPPQSKPISLPKTPRRRWFRYSLRTLLLLTLLLCTAARWMAVRAERQKAAVAAILADGGSVYYDYQFKAGDAGYGQFEQHPAPYGPVFLRALL